MTSCVQSSDLHNYRSDLSPSQNGQTVASYGMVSTLEKLAPVSLTWSQQCL